jgi:hypothetical protein
VISQIVGDPHGCMDLVCLSALRGVRVSRWARLLFNHQKKDGLWVDGHVPRGIDVRNMQTTLRSSIPRGEDKHMVRALQPTRHQNVCV